MLKSSNKNEAAPHQGRIKPRLCGSICLYLLGPILAQNTELDTACWRLIYVLPLGSFGSE